MTDYSRRKLLAAGAAGGFIAAAATRADAATYDKRPMDGVGPRNPGAQALTRARSTR